MATPKERYVVDQSGNRIEVILAIKDYENLLEEIEELEAIRAYEAAKASGDDTLSMHQAIEEIERER